MRKWFLAIALLVSGTVYGTIFTPLEGSSLVDSAFNEDVIEIDLTKAEIKIVNFHLGTYKANGKFNFTVNKENSSLILDVMGRGITFENKIISWLSARLVLRENIISIPYFYSPQFIANGEIDLKNNKLSFDLEGSWQEESRLLEGEIKMKVKAWGSISSFLISGHLKVDGGKYKGKDFSYLRLDFLGRPPLLNITDSQLRLRTGNVVEIKGTLDLRDFSNILPEVKYEVQKAYIGQWQLFSEEDENIGLKKQLDGKIGVFVNAGPETEAWGPQTELLYNWKDDQYLRLKMQGEDTILRFEKRKDF